MSLAFSAPGKALLAGGYLVLDSFDSYVVALSARMHCLVSSAEEDTAEYTIDITSPQFQNGAWKYQYKDGEVVGLDGKNPFIEATLKSVLVYLKRTQLNKSLKLTIFSDKEYHSQQDTVSKGRFLFHSQSINNVPKTGLGSSAGLVTVITTALLSQFIDLDISNKEHLNIIHNLAQYSHCQAQGKVGSGFDVAAATYGSIVYKRFDPFLISSDRDLTELINSDWNIKNEKVKLPLGIKLLMGDIKTGSNTPKLISKVKAWKEADPKHASNVYSSQDTANQTLINSLRTLNEYALSYPEQYSGFLEVAAGNKSTDNYPTAGVFFKSIQLLTSIIDSIRQNFRQITEESGAEIEPPTQTKLLDACLKYNGVLGGVVPGAGGFDAIALLIIGDAVGEFIKLTKDDQDFQNVEWLDLSEDSEGLKSEAPQDYAQLL